jgi:rod shape-determining protein MreD
MRWVRFSIFLLIVTLLQAGLLDVFAVSSLSVKPDLLLILLVFFAVFCPTADAIITSFVIGFAADLIWRTMGPYTISFGVFGTLLAYLNRVVVLKAKHYQAIVIFFVGLLAHLAAHLISLVKMTPVGQDVFKMVFWTCLYSGLIGPFLFLPTAWWMRIKTVRFGRK